MGGILSGFLAREERKKQRDLARIWQLTTGMDVALRPFFKKKYLLSKAEQCFYKVLRDVVSPNHVVPKVRLADLVDADKRHHLWLSNFRRICSKHIDFVVCDPTLSPVIAIELDGSSHDREDRRKRDRDVDRILEIASLPIVRVRVQKEYCLGEIERRILAALEVANCRR